jgi:hypothetical protein
MLDHNQETGDQRAPLTRTLARRNWFFRLSLRVARWFTAEIELHTGPEPD